MHSVVLSSLPLSHSLIFFLNLFLVLAFIFCFGLVLEGFEFVFFFLLQHTIFFSPHVSKPYLSGGDNRYKYIAFHRAMEIYIG